MKRIFCCLGVLLMLISVPVAVHAGDLMAEADALYTQGGMANFKQAIGIYETFLKTHPDDYATNWKCARAYREYANLAKRKGVDKWKEICATYGKTGMKYAQKAIALNPNKVDGYYYYGLNVGIYSDGVSILTALSEGLKGKTQSSFEKAYALDKNYQKGGPMLSLGRFWAVLPWPLDDDEKSLKYYREFQASPYFAGNAEAHIFIAELLMDIGGSKNKTEARTLLEDAVKDKDPYFHDWAKRLLAKL